MRRFVVAEDPVKAVVCREFGPPEKLVIEEVPDPSPGPGQLLVEVRAAGVSFPDALIVEDKYQLTAKLPFTPGGEVAGIVRQLGPEARGFAVGDRVCTGTLTGGFAELAVVNAGAARRIPEGLELAQATGLFYGYGTALYALRDRGRLAAGETLLVLGAGGGVGIAGVEVGKLLGARVIAAASSHEKLSVCRERGADELVLYSEEDLKERVKELTDGRGADVVYDPVGGEYAEAALRATAWEGRFLVLGFTAGIPKVALNLPLLKGCQIVGVFLGSMMGREPGIAEALTAEIDALCAKGALRPYISRMYPLHEAPQALRDLTERRVVGRVVVTP